ncbi:hypothetical protein [Enterobacter sp.]|uniref:hypothetical protein n=1 Tax=Enterobacter sp. TaxID=42895 RepID=UPI00296FC252|nr:hypothetical protein [Enterobacter sp.]
MKIYFKNDFLLGLYALLRQLELSIHRGMCDWAGLQEYIYSREVIHVINYLADPHISKPQQSITSLLHKAITFTFKKGYISDIELNKIITILISTHVILNGDKAEKDEIIKLRMNVRNFSDMIRHRIQGDKKRLQLADKIEHFNQSDYGEFYKIEDIVPVKWYMHH